MAYHPSDADVRLLDIISYGCTCGMRIYLCGLCTAVVDHEPEEFRRLVQVGLIFAGSYTAFHLTTEGKKVLIDRGRGYRLS